MVLGLGITNEPLEYPPDWSPTDDNLHLRLALWLQGGVGVSSAVWVDSSDSGRNATAPEVSNQPSVTISDGIEGLDFDQTGTSQFLDFNTITISEQEPFTFAIVVRLDANTNQVIFSDSNNEFIEIQNNRSLRIKTDVPSNVTTNLKHTSSVFTTGSTKIIYLSRTDDGVFEWRVDGEKIVIDSATSTNITNTGGFDIQNLCIRNDNDRALDGQVREVIFYESVVFSTSQSRNLHQYLSDKYNITINHD
tara:strand:- start:6765 stop:7511 length:747 start_codon:yes stop_codon:yes gene_type:complete